MAGASPERLRLFLDVTVLIKAASFPRLPFEIVRLGLRGEAGIVLSPLVLERARFHLRQKYPSALPFLERLLQRLDYQEVPNPDPERVTAHRNLCRDESDVPVALAAIDAGVDYLVTNDRDLTVVDASTTRLREQVKIITPLALLRHVLGWPEERIAAAIHRNWHELSTAEWQEIEAEP
jgi:predicted nucleic acid-binding protein